jgi:hypothetical protein
MNRLPLALMWLLALTAGALPVARPPAGWRSEASITRADAVDAPSLFRPARAERLQVGAPARPSPWRHVSPQVDFSWASPDAELRVDAPIGRSPRPLAPRIVRSGLGAPRFPTGPPSA